MDKEGKEVAHLFPPTGWGTAALSPTPGLSPLFRPCATIPSPQGHPIVSQHPCWVEYLPGAEAVSPPWEMSTKVLPAGSESTTAAFQVIS